MYETWIYEILWNYRKWLTKVHTWKGLNDWSRIINSFLIVLGSEHFNAFDYLFSWVRRTCRQLSKHFIQLSTKFQTFLAANCTMRSHKNAATSDYFMKFPLNELMTWTAVHRTTTKIMDFLSRRKSNSLWYIKDKICVSQKGQSTPKTVYNVAFGYLSGRLFMFKWLWSRMTSRPPQVYGSGYKGSEQEISGLVNFFWSADVRCFSVDGIGSFWSKPVCCRDGGRQNLSFQVPYVFELLHQKIRSWRHPKSTRCRFQRLMAKHPHRCFFRDHKSSGPRTQAYHKPK